MAILNYTTTIKASKTLSEIADILVEHGATSINTVYDPATKRPVSVRFGMDVDGDQLFYELPANYEGVSRAMLRDGKLKPAQRSMDHAVNVAWRIIKDWIEAQCAMNKAGVVEMSQVFMPYFLTAKGTTLFEEFKESHNKLLGA